MIFFSEKLKFGDLHNEEAMRAPCLGFSYFDLEKSIPWGYLGVETGLSFGGGHRAQGPQLCIRDVTELSVLHPQSSAGAQEGENALQRVAPIHQWPVNELTASQIHSLISEHTNEAAETILPASGASLMASSGRKICKEIENINSWSCLQRFHLG